MKHVKKIVLWTLVIFFIYSVVVSPGQAADIVHTAWDILVKGVKNIGTFFNAILNRK